VRLSNISENTLKIRVKVKFPNDIIAFMQSGALIQLEEDFDVEKLDKCRWDRTYSKHKLKGVIQFEGNNLRIGDLNVKPATALYERLVQLPVIEEINGVYRVIYKDSVRADSARVFIAKGLALVDSLGNRPFVRDIINKSQKRAHLASDVTLNTYKLSKDHEDQWTYGFSDRMGRVQKGIVYGNAVEKDSVFGPEFENCSSRSVGWNTDFFGAPVKVRVSPRGSVTIMTIVPPEVFLNFIRKEIVPYIISL
jgi:hypothetical protein